MMKEIQDKIKRICSMLQIDIPILQGAMAYIANYKLAAAVSEYGGLGILAAGGLKSEQLEYEINELKKCTKKSYAVNIALKSDNVEEIICILKDQKVPIVVTGAGNPEKYISELKGYGAKVIPVVASVALAKRMARYGADAVIAEGSESGGHIGNTNTMCLIPQVVDAVDIPVIAAGGIADGRGAAASFILGACAVQMGTRFLVSSESPAHKNYKELLLRAKDISTVVLNTTQNDQDNIRAVKSLLTGHYLEAEFHGREKLGWMLKDALKKAAKNGDSSQGLFMAGQCAGLIKEELSVEEILKQVWGDACKYLEL